MLSLEAKYSAYAAEYAVPLRLRAGRSSVWIVCTIAFVNTALLPTELSETHSRGTHASLRGVLIFANLLTWPNHLSIAYAVLHKAIDRSMYAAFI